jgi:hypothetical protein
LSYPTKTLSKVALGGKGEKEGKVGRMTISSLDTFHDFTVDEVGVDAELEF